jgi:hypothetical protein
MKKKSQKMANGGMKRMIKYLAVGIFFMVGAVLTFLAGRNIDSVLLSALSIIAFIKCTLKTKKVE